MATPVDKEEQLIKDVKRLKDSTYGVTAIKVELEAQLSRGYDGEEDHEDVERDEDGNCVSCTNGRQTCETCDGEYEHHDTCWQCEGDGRYADCDNCDGDGTIATTSINSTVVSTTDCGECDGTGLEACGECDGTGGFPCEYCSEGTNECDECGGNYHVEPQAEGAEIAYNWSSDRDCHNFMMRKLTELGLAEEMTAEERLEMIDRDNGDLPFGGRSKYRPVYPLIYAKFYNDGSVDSEFTFTVSLKEETNIFVLPKVVEAFNALSDAIGNGREVIGAGMHMALLRHPDGLYPDRTDRDDGRRDRRFQNFSRSMKLLLPAMFFLGSPGEQSRGLSFRRPDIGYDTHRCAIDLRTGNLEYRLFETCYDNPEYILDNVSVIANTIKYWSDKYIPSGVEKVTTEISFGVDSGNKVERFYTSERHIELLNAGIEKLKPAYRTIRELKQQRGFKLNRGSFKNTAKRLAKQAKLEYGEYLERFEYKQLCDKKYAEYSYLEGRSTSRGRPADAKKTLADAKKHAAQVVSSRQPTPLENFIQNRVRELTNHSQGDYTLSCN